MRSAHRILITAAAFALSFSAIPAFAIYPISTVMFADANTGYLAGQYNNSPRHGFVSVTHDGGATWHAVSIDNVSPSGIAVSTAGAAYAVSKDDDVLLRTTDTGATWSRITPVLGGGTLPGSPAFADVTMASTGIVAVGKWVGTEDGDIATIYTGATGVAPTTKRYTGPIYPWPVDGLGDPIGDRPQTYAKMGSVALAPGGTTGWAFGGEWEAPSYANVDWKGLLIQKTTNGGATWTTATPPASLYNLNDAVAIDASTAYAVGPIRLMIKTTNGTTWTRSDLPRIGVASLDAYGVDATDANHVVVVGLSSSGHGAIQWTTDGWNPANSNQHSYTATGFPTLRSVSMITPTKWIVVGDNETIGRTNDAGATWTFTQLAPPTVALTTPSAYAGAPSVATAVLGTAADAGAGVASVHIAVRRDDGKYWNGISWASSTTTAFWNAASTTNGWNTWTWNWQPDPTQVGSHTYQVTARATDAFGQTAESVAAVIYTITPTAGASGTISPGTVQTVNSGGGMTFTITPDAGYHIASLVKNGVPVTTSSSVTFAGVTSNQTLSATFAINTYTITPTANPNGTITPGTAQTVDHGTSKTFAITPNPGYRIAYVLKDGVSVGAVSSVTFDNVTADHTVSATFAINTYTITPTAGANGTITPNTAQPVNHGASKTFAIAANTGYHIVDVLKDGVSVGALSSVTFDNVTENHTLSATFAVNPANTYTVTPTAGSGGTITPGVQQMVGSGDSATFTVAHNTGYHIVDVLKDGVSIGASESVTFANVTANHRLSATFAVDQTVTRVEGRSRYDVAANLARKGWDPAGDKSWTGVTHVIVACGDNGKEADPLAAAGLAGVYNSPVLLTGVTSVPASTITAIREIAAANPGVQIHLIGGVNSLPDARWNTIKAIPGVNQTKDRIEGRSRYDVSAAIAGRMINELGAQNLGGVLIVAGDNLNGFYDALAASPIAYANAMPILSVQKDAVPTSVNYLLTGVLANVPRHVVNSTTYVSDATKTKVKAQAARLATSSNRYTAASQIAVASINNGWLTSESTAIAAKLPDALTGGVFSGKNGGVMLFTDSTSVIQSATKSFVTGRKAGIVNGWVLGGINSVPVAQEASFRNLLK